MTLQKAKSKIKEERILIKDALKRSYKVKTFIEKKYNRKHCRVYLPICFEGKILKLKEIQ